ncbi:MAG: class II fructose-bisphosphate aldolase [Synergistaceae bacterium]|nr:class II fructose-bisphosphate aldolase [Synergistaceae bacterium]
MCGLFNGVIITQFNVVPMITTLATMTMVRGLTYIVTGGTAVFGLPAVFSFLGAGRLIKNEASPNGIIPVVTLFTIAVIFLMHVLLSKTVFGRHVYASGSNANVAHLSGINVKRVTLISHVLCGIMAALGGVLVASKLQNGQPAACEGYEMYAIASTVLGGTSLTGGSGSVARAMFGVAIIAVINNANNGMNLLHISSYWQKVVIGTIILLDETVSRAARLGMSKVNFATELRDVYTKALKEYIASDPGVFDPKQYGSRARTAVKELVKHKARDCAPRQKNPTRRLG